MTRTEDLRASASHPASRLTFEADPLGWLTWPLERDHFLSEYLEKKWLVAGDRDADRFRDLLSITDLDRLLGEFGLRTPDIKLVKHEEDVPMTDYVYRDDLVDPMRVGRLFAEGATVIFAGLHDRHEPVRRLCTAVSQQATLRTQANIYLTPPHSQGFDIHWDTHDVFVIQVEGTKHWRIYDGGPEHPLAGQKFDPEKHSAGPMIDEFTLEPGQVLYIPRGVMHAAAATDDISLHVTLGVMAYTWSELLADCLTDIAARSPEWRENLPLGFGSAADATDSIGAELRARLERFAAELNVGEILAGRVEYVEDSHRPRVGDHLRQAMAAKGLSDDQHVERRPGLPSRMERTGDRVVVRSGSREVTFPAAAERTLRQVLDGGSVSVSSIDDELDGPSRRMVISALIREGIVTTKSNGTREVTHGR